MEITVNLFWIIIIVSIAFCFLTISIISFLIHNGFSINLFSKHDNKIIDKFLEKYPSVNPLFFNKSITEQNIENNQEIHEINKRFDKTDVQIEEIKNTLASLTKVIEELQKNG